MNAQGDMAAAIHDDPEFGAVSLDRLTPSWHVFQLRKGHRFSNDDKLCAWRAAEWRPEARELLDLGSGIGSVGLSTLWRMKHSTARLVMVEAQAVSTRLARRSIALNGLEARVSVVEQDLRDFECDHHFDLITGSPPYFPASQAIASDHSQKAHCRLELRGGVDDYCAAAAQLLAIDGVFVFVMAASDARCMTSPKKHGLAVVERYDFKFKDDGRCPHVCVTVCSKQVARVSQFQLILRDEHGERTLEYRSWQEYMQLPPGRASLAEIRRILSALEAAQEVDALRLAVSEAERIGMRSTQGSRELREARLRLREAEKREIRS